MYTIYHNTNDEKHNFESFKVRMLDICNEHKKDDRALAFAFILYDFTNPHVWKILNDREYWLALNEISGKYLTVFSLNYKEKKPIIHRNAENFDTMHFMVKIETEFNPSENTNSLVKKYFGDEVEINYPSILFFQVDNDSIVDLLLINLKENKIEEGFIELKEYIQNAVSALKRITPDNKENYHEIFNCLEREVNGAKSSMIIKRITKNAGGVIGLLSSIKGLFL